MKLYQSKRYTVHVQIYDHAQLNETKTGPRVILQASSIKYRRLRDAINMGKAFLQGAELHPDNEGDEE